FVGNVADVPCKILAQPRGGLLAFVLGLGFAQGGDGLERELGVDRQRAPVGQEYRAIGPALVRERKLAFVAGLRQPSLPDELHAPLAECGALRLVRECGWSRGYWRRQIGYVFSRVVAAAESLVESLQGLARMVARRGHGLFEMVRSRTDPLIDGAVKLGLA